MCSTIITNTTANACSYYEHNKTTFDRKSKKKKWIGVCCCCRFVFFSFFWFYFTRNTKWNLKNFSFTIHFGYSFVDFSFVVVCESLHHSVIHSYVSFVTVCVLLSVFMWFHGTTPIPANSGQCDKILISHYKRPQSKRKRKKIITNISRNQTVWCEQLKSVRKQTFTVLRIHEWWKMRWL